MLSHDTLLIYILNILAGIFLKFSIYCYEVLNLQLVYIFPNLKLYHLFVFLNSFDGTSNTILNKSDTNGNSYLLSLEWKINNFQLFTFE